MAEAVKLKGRYDLKDTLGRGGMGVVYRAYDHVLKCDVAVKTLREAPDPAALQLFYRECETLVALNHPNIVPILDIGEVEEEGQRKPYFVMPLLPGTTLDKVIKSAGTRLTTERRIEILAQVCRGLHAAHEHGLVHRDVKPSNVFVMPDYSAEIIDFGVAHMVSSGTTGVKGTLFYMAPELIEGKRPSPLSDIFALGVMAFELFTRRRPFEGPTEREIVEAILHESPPPASDLDPSINQAISRVIHKTLAKQPWHRFSTAAEFADCLGKAHRGEPIEYFDSGRIQPRIQRAKTAFEQGDHQFAAEILAELEAEGHLDSELSLLHKQVEVAGRQARVRQLIEGARSRFQSDEYPLALQKVQEILSLEPDNADALSLKSKIESARSEGQIEGWFRLARQHIDNQAFTHSREALQNVLQMRPHDTRAAGLMLEVNRREQEFLRIRQEKEQLYQAAVEDYQKGDVSGALTKLERVQEMERKAPDIAHQERGNSYQTLYNQVRSEHHGMQNAYAEARKHLAEQGFAKALEICEQYLQKYPGHALFQSLKFDVQEQQRLQLSGHIAETDRRLEAEADLERKVGIIQEALVRFPGESHFERLLRIVRERLDLVNGIVAKARYHEERGQFTEALGQLEILKTIHAKYSGLQFDIERVTKRRDQQVRADSKTRWVQQIDANLESGEFAQALAVARNALEEFADDGELQALAQMAKQSEGRTAEAQRLHAEGERLFDGQRYEEGLEALQRASEMDPRNEAVRTSLANRLVARAQRLVETDSRTAQLLIERALDINPEHAAAKGVRLLLEDLRREDFVNQALSRIRQYQAAGDAAHAWAEIERALGSYPEESRLLQLRPTLENTLRPSQRTATQGSAVAAIETAKVQPAAPAPPPVEPEPTVAPAPEDPLAEGPLATPPITPGLNATMILQGSAQDLARVPVPPVSRPFPPARARRLPRWALFWPGAAVLLVMVLLAGVWALRHPNLVGSSTAALSFQIRTTPPGASLLVDGKAIGMAGSSAALAAGDYQVQLLLNGYRPELVALSLRPGTAAPALHVTLKPLPQKLQVISNLASGNVTLDGGAPAVLAPNVPLPLNVPMPGRHTLTWEAAGQRVRLAFEIRPAALPILESLEASKGIDAVVVSALRDRALVRSTFGRVAARLGDRDLGRLGADIMEIKDVAPGGQRLELGQGAQCWTGMVEAGPQPSLAIFVSSGARAMPAVPGSILVRISGSGPARVLLDGALKGTTNDGTLSVAAAPGAHRIEVSREGFLDPAPQAIEVKSGDQSTVSFLLTNAIPVSMAGRLQIKFSPVSAEIFCTRADEPTPKRAAAGTMELPEGQYVVSAQAPGYVRQSTSISVKSGALRKVSLVLKRQPEPVVRAMNPADWDRAWTQDGGWFRAQGGGAALYRITPTIGVFQFTLHSPKARWLLGYIDERNYTLFELDKQSYSSLVYRNGKKTVRVDKKRHAPTAEYFNVRMTVEPNRVAVALVTEGSVIPLDDWTGPEMSGAGRFGFYLQGNSQLWLANFTFTSQPPPE